MRIRQQEWSLSVGPGNRRFLTRLFCLLSLVFVCGVHAQTHQGVELVQARLVADSETVAPGRPVTLGLHLKMAEGWHTYWEYSGDAGLPTSLDLDLPDGFRATAIQWPLPYHFLEPGDLETYGYKDEVLLLVRVFPPAEIDGTEIEITGSSSWLVCEAICLPGQAGLSLTLAVADSLEPSHTELFERFRGKLPSPLNGEAPEVTWERNRQELRLEVAGDEAWTYDFYPLPGEGVVVGHPKSVARTDGAGALIRIPLSQAPSGLARLPGVLVAEEKESGERRGWRISGR